MTALEIRVADEAGQEAMTKLRSDIIHLICDANTNPNQDFTVICCVVCDMLHTSAAIGEDLNGVTERFFESVRILLRQPDTLSLAANQNQTIN